MVKTTMVSDHLFAEARVKRFKQESEHKTVNKTKKIKLGKELIMSQFIKGKDYFNSHHASEDQVHSSTLWCT